ncbi:MAG TPA: SPOR domain-containing protein [Kofleriaceae bacterium]
MPSREPELYKDKIEVSLDGRQIFYLFFGGAVIVGLMFVIGVMVGRRVEARGHLDRAQTQTASDPLAALDRLERSDNLSFHGALTGGDATTDVEKAIAERAAAKPDKPAEAKAPAPAPVVAPAAEIKADKPAAEGEKKHKKHDDDKHADKAASEKSAEKSDRSADKSDKSSEKSDKSSEKSGRFTLQLSSFQDKSEAEAFLSSMKSAGYQAYLTEAEVNGKGTFYRVRLGSYRSVDAASDAKAEYEKSARKTAQVMKL